jgi:hypothetical protein
MDEKIYLPGSYTPGTTGRRLGPKKNLGMTRLPLATNDWGATNPIPGMDTPLLAQGEGPPT